MARFEFVSTSGSRLHEADSLADLIGEPLAKRLSEVKTADEESRILESARELDELFHDRRGRAIVSE